MPRVSSADAATLSARYLVEALKHPTTNTYFATINDANNTSLRNLAELFNIIPIGEEHQLTNRNNGERCEVEREPEQGCTKVTHIYPTRQE